MARLSTVQFAEQFGRMVAAYGNDAWVSLAVKHGELTLEAGETVRTGPLFELYGVDPSAPDAEVRLAVGLFLKHEFGKEGNDGP